jgi:hypothetical protein
MLLPVASSEDSYPNRIDVQLQRVSTSNSVPNPYSRPFLQNIEIRYNWLAILRFTMMPIGSEPVKISSTWFVVRCNA